jgi:transcription initiation factor TFIIIB Brf1 subunit/transcription initiation factor TFIIB
MISMEWRIREQGQSCPACGSQQIRTIWRPTENGYICLNCFEVSEPEEFVEDLDIDEVIHIKSINGLQL